MTYDDRKTPAVDEFIRTWTDYRYPTRAATLIAEKYGIGRSTLVGWVRERGAWPSQRAARVLELEEENALLREELRALRAEVETLKARRDDS